MQYEEPYGAVYSLHWGCENRLTGIYRLLIIPAAAVFVIFAIIFLSMHLQNQIKEAAVAALQAVYQADTDTSAITLNLTRPEFEGDFTIVLFNFLKTTGQKPDVLGNALGGWLIENYSHLFSGFNVIKGFLNLTIRDKWYIGFLHEQYNNSNYLRAASNGKRVMVEYSSPNTNKPLHLGHLRNNFLGLSTAALLEAAGYDVVKTCIVNDRGIHICKSMIAWMLLGKNETPESTGMKGDHFVGKYYVLFNDIYKDEVAQLVEKGNSKETAEKEAAIMKAAAQMLVDWEAGQPEVISLWEKMNNWVYAGFDTTYKRIGSSFDRMYYESNTYLLGKEYVEQGLQKNIFFKKEDGSVWADLTAEGLDEKIVQRRDGTSVYITQDLGLAADKYNEFHCDKSIYVIADEQNYHMKVLKALATRLEIPKADGIYHLSYGMVELPTGKMKSREGTVVDADDIVDQMIQIAADKTTALGKVNDFSAEELKELYLTIGLGALKFFLLRVDPKKRIIFNPEESIDFHGYTGPFIQYTYARIQSILRKNDIVGAIPAADTETLAPLEKKLLVQLESFPATIQEAALQYDPAALCMALFNLSQSFNSFYNEHSVTHAETSAQKNLRLQLAALTALVLREGMALLKIDVPERM